jgi:hypothetical protein
LNLFRGILLLQLAITVALGQVAQKSKPTSLPTQPEVLVRSLYTQVVARHPHDIPNSAEMKIFAPYLSKALLHRIDLAKACSDDWDRQNPEPHLKAEMASQYGLFSANEWGGEPRAFKIERTQSEKDGSSLVYVNLTSVSRYGDPWSSRVAAVVLREDGHYVIDDVVYINDSTYDPPADKPADRRLSEYLDAGCDGPRWIGYSLPNQPEALINTLYQQVVARRPSGIPWGEDWKIFAPYMSKALLHRIDDFNACSTNWFRLHYDPKHPAKPPFGVYESGVFSGGDELTGPRAFQIERTEAEKDGSVRVYVKLAWWDAPVDKPDKWRVTQDKPYVWEVAPIVVRENGRLVVDDVIHLKNKDLDKEYRLSNVLAQGCEGPRWVGYKGY